MFKILITFIFTTNVFACDNIPFFEKLRYKEKSFTLSTNLRVMANGKTIAEISQPKSLKTLGKFDVKKLEIRIDGKLVATASQKLLSIGSKTEVFDCQGKLLGSIDENQVKGALSVNSKYELLDANNKHIGKSDMNNLVRTKLEINGDNFKFIAKRDYLNIFSDGWSISQSGSGDQRLLLFIPALKTLSDNKKRK